MKYILSVGIEAHFELLTDSKLFCGCATQFGANPNTHCCPVCIGLPGSLPVMNKKAVDLAIRAGIATYCEINNVSFMDRKNYFYPDLSKEYQVTQYYMPVCENGYVNLGSNRKVRIDRIHIEEDAGKIVYRDNDILIDYNRSGVPLIEIVSKPDIHSLEEAHEYIEKLIDLMRYIGVSDCKMQEGSVRCDVNISVKEKNSELDGVKVEIKNINSVKFIAKAIEYEMNRQIAILESGNKVLKETRRYNEKTRTTEVMRTKEDAVDYRYFKEPDLVDFEITNQEIDDIRREMPEDFDTRLKRYIVDFNLNETDAKNLMKYSKAADFFDEASVGVSKKKIVSNFIFGQIFSKLETQDEKQGFNVKISSKDLNDLCKMIEEDRIDYALAKEIIEKVMDTTEKFSEVMAKMNFSYMNDEDAVKLCRNVLLNNKNAINDFKAGKSHALQYLVGQVMKQATAQVNAKKVTDILKELLK